MPSSVDNLASVVPSFMRCLHLLEPCATGLPCCVAACLLLLAVQCPPTALGRLQGWIPNLERKLEVAAETAHADFRCFFSAEPINGAPQVSCDVLLLCKTWALLFPPLSSTTPV